MVIKTKHIIVPMLENRSFDHIVSLIAGQACSFEKRAVE